MEQRPPAAEGPAWRQPQHVSTTATSGASVPTIRQAPDGLLMIMYTAGLMADTDPAYSLSADGGLTWSQPAPVHTSSGLDSVQVSFDFDNNGVAQAVWKEGDTLFHASQNEWPSNTSHTIVESQDLILDPEIVAGGPGTLDVVWSETESTSLKNIYHSRSIDSGLSWSPPTALATSTQDSNVPAIAVGADGVVHVVWEETVLPDFVLHYARGTGNGETITWSAPQEIASGVSRAKRPALLADGQFLHLAFTRQDSTAEQYAYYTTSTDSGLSWSAAVDSTNDNPVSVNTTDPFNLIVAIAPCDNDLYLYYHGTLGEFESEQLYGANQNSGWTPRDQATGGSSRAINPSLVCDGALHLAYELIDPASGAHQVYYTHGQLNGYSSHLPLLRRSR